MAARKTATTTGAAKTATKAIKNETPVTDSVTSVETVSHDEDANKPIIPKDVSPNTIISVKNGFQGKLVYISPKTGEIFSWEEYGDEQDMELSELRNAKSSRKAFFKNNWFMFDEDNEWVIPYLGLGEFYRGAIRLEELDEICKNSPDRIKDIIGNLSDGQKRSVQYRAQQLISEGEIDSRKAIAALEEALGVDLIEK